MMTQSYAGGSYDSGTGYYGGGYYSTPGPGGYLDASDDLTGPGSTAYLHDGPYSSYAYEGYHGNFYQRNETQFSGGYSKSTSYYVSNGSYTVEHDTSVSYHNPPNYYNFGGYSNYGYGNGVTNNYTSLSSESYYSSGYQTIDFQSFSQTTYADGGYHDTYSSTSGAYEDGMKIPGSATAYSSSSYGYLPNDMS